MDKLNTISNLVFSDCLLEFDLLLLLSLLEDLRRNFIIGMIRYNTNGIHNLQIKINTKTKLDIQIT